MTKWHCGGTCDDRPAGGVWAGWERTGLAVGGWTRVRAGVSSTQANQGVFVLMCLLCVVVRRKVIQERTDQRDYSEKILCYSLSIFVVI